MECNLILIEYKKKNFENIKSNNEMKKLKEE